MTSVHSPAALLYVMPMLGKAMDKRKNIHKNNPRVDGQYNQPGDNLPRSGTGSERYRLILYEKQEHNKNIPSDPRIWTEKINDHGDGDQAVSDGRKSHGEDGWELDI